MDTLKEDTLYEQFYFRAKSDIKGYREKLKGDGSFDYLSQVNQLIMLSNKMNLAMLQHLFGEQLGLHLTEKFVYKSNRDLLHFLNSIDGQYRLFILHELKNNPESLGIFI